MRTCCIIIVMVKLIITENEADQRLDRFLRKYFRKATLGFIYKLIRKDVKLNGRRAGEDTMLRRGDELTIYIPEEKAAELSADTRRKTSKRQFRIAYEDDNILIADKPWGLLTHGDSHEKKNTLVNQVCGYLQDNGEYNPSRERSFTPAPVNRLDRNTTGLVIFGKNAAALRALTKSIRERDNIEKYYLTIVCGELKEPLFLDDSLRRDTDRNISEISRDGDGKSAFTYVKPIAAGKKFSLVEVRIFTGRTHQIRTHLAHAGFPLAGDSKYGDPAVNRRLKKEGITTQLLHACRLEFKGCIEELEYLEGKRAEASPPPDFRRAQKLLIPDTNSR